MKMIDKIKSRFKGLIDSVERYPVTAMFLIAAAVTLAVAIHTDKDYSKLMFTFAIGAVLSIVIQAKFERFFSKLSTRLIMTACGIVLTAGYYLLIRSSSEAGMEIGIKTSVFIAALIIAFIWAPSIKSNIRFEDSFMAVFKAFFQTVFYAAILMGGLSLIIAAVHTLIYPISYKAYSYIADIIFVLFSPILFLSLIPIYPGKYKPDIDENDEKIKKAVHCPKFVDVLFSYIIIPLIAVYSVILLIYIATNIGKDFWSNNLLEPMLITYAIAVIATYILTSRLENNFVKLFRKIFPKALIVIVLFQLTSTIINLNNTGITFERYYVILFGIFAAASGALMCFKKSRNGIIAVIFIGLCVISIIPSIDAFSVSRISQTNRLQTALIKNQMLEDNKIKPNSSISDEDKKIIIQSVQYLRMTDDIKEIEWLADEFETGRDFYNIFGFNEYEMPQNDDTYVSIFFDTNNPIEIKGYDILTQGYIFSKDDIDDETIRSINYSNKSYSLVKEKLANQYDIVLFDNDKNEIIRINTNELFSRYDSFGQSKEGISEKDATFIFENNKVKLKIIIKDLYINRVSNEKLSNTSFYILIKFK